MARQVSRAEEDLERSDWSAVCHSRRFRRETPIRHSVRTMASAEIQAWCGRKTSASPSCRALVTASRAIAP